LPTGHQTKWVHEQSTGIRVGGVREFRWSILTFRV
jgi:hypothetical protein